MLAKESGTDLSPRRPWLVALAEPASLISALKWGAGIGVAYYVLSLLLNLATNAIVGVNPNLSQNLLAAVPSCLGIFALVFALYSAGNRAAVERMHIAPGLLGAVVMYLVSFALSKLYSPAVQAVTSKTTTPASNLILQIVSFLLFVGVVVVGIGYVGAFYGLKNKLKAMAKQG